MNFNEITLKNKQESTSSSDVTMLQDDKEGIRSVSPSKSMVETKPIEAIYLKTEEEAEVMICEASIKQELLLSNEAESVEEVKDLESNDDDPCGSSSSSAKKAFICPPVLRSDDDSSVISDKNIIGSVSLEPKHLTAPSKTNGLSSRGLKRCWDQLQSMTVLADGKSNTSMLLPSDCMANKDHSEHGKIKEEEDCKYEVTIEQEPLPWEEPNLKEDFKIATNAVTNAECRMSNVFKMAERARAAASTSNIFSDNTQREKRPCYSATCLQISELRSKDKLWLVDKLATNEFPRNLLPITGEVLRVLEWHAKRNPRDLIKAIRETTLKIQEQWENANVPTIDRCHILKKVRKLHDEYAALKKSKSRESGKAVEHRMSFQVKLKNLFDIAHRDAMQLMTIIEDRDFLEAQRGHRRERMLEVDKD